MYNKISKTRAVSEIVWKNAVEPRRYKAAQKRCGLHAGQVRSEYRNTQLIFNTFLLFHGSSGYANAPYCYVIRSLSVLL